MLLKFPQRWDIQTTFAAVSTIKNLASPVNSDWRCIIFINNDIGKPSIVVWKVLNHFIQSSGLPSNFVACNLGTDFWKQVDLEMGFWYEAEPSVADAKTDLRIVDLEEISMIECSSKHEMMCPGWLTFVWILRKRFRRQGTVNRISRWISRWDTNIGFHINRWQNGIGMNWASGRCRVRQNKLTWHFAPSGCWVKFRGPVSVKNCWVAAATIKCYP